jgi:hypothetical protein
VVINVPYDRARTRPLPGIIPHWAYLVGCSSIFQALKSWARSSRQWLPVRKSLLDADTIPLLDDIVDILRSPHEAQELLSAEKTPTLSLALPTYELLVQRWTVMKQRKPLLAPLIDVGIKKIEEFVFKSRDC